MRRAGELIGLLAHFDNVGATCGGAQLHFGVVHFNSSGSKDLLDVLHAHGAHEVMSGLPQRVWQALEDNQRPSMRVSIITAIWHRVASVFPPYLLPWVPIYLFSPVRWTVIYLRTNEPTATGRHSTRAELHTPAYSTMDG